MRSPTRLRHLTVFAILTPLSFGLAACGGDSGTDPEPPPPPPPPPITVSIAPTTATLDQGGTSTFTATVTGTQNTAVNWTSTGGSISGQGGSATLTAPTSAGSVTVTATSIADPQQSAAATVTVRAVTLSLDVSDGSLFRSETMELAATVEGTVDTDVDWTASCGEIDGSGAQVSYRAPATPGECSVIAASAADASQSAMATFTISPDLVVNALDDADDGVCDPEHCSLREALALAHDEADEIATGVIVFHESLDGGTIVLDAELPPITANVVIDGPGAELLAVDADAGETDPRRVFEMREATIEVRGLTLTGGYASGSGGAIAILDGANVTLSDVVVTGNHAADEGGGIFVSEAEGSAIGIRVAENVAGTSGGGLYTAQSIFLLTDSEVSGNTSVSAGAAIRVVDGDVRLVNTDIIGNITPSVGGGLYVSNAALDISGGRIVRNESLQGGGAAITAFSTAQDPMEVVIRDVIIEENWTQSVGGGMLIVGSGATTVLLEGLEVRGNVALTGGGGLSVAASDGTITNTTLSGNEGGNGAALRLGGQMAIVNVTVVGNVSTNTDEGTGGAIQVAMPNAHVELANVLLAMNESGGESRNCAVATAVATTMSATSQGNSLSDDATCGDFMNHEDDMHDTEAGVDPELADNGGATRTHALLEGSPAIGGGNPDTCPDTDQRGFARGTPCDIGAFERGGTAPIRLAAPSRGGGRR